MPPTTLFEQLSRRLGEIGAQPQDTGVVGRRYRCACGRPVFFRNSACLACGRALGYDCERGLVLALEPEPAPGLWREASGAALYRRCANFDTAAGCNWLVPAADGGPARCVACRLNRTIPDLGRDDNALLWQRIELAKRRVVSQLVLLGLPVRSRLGEDPQRGLAFDLLRAPPGGRIVTGHEAGIVTLDIEEADDARREAVRAAMAEPYRTLLGHFRHEVGHYYWERLVRDTHWLAPFRALFGDERADYHAALQANAAHGPREDWALGHVSGYASVHPWEDWAETWAHYLHMVDVVHTAVGFGLDAGAIGAGGTPFDATALWRPDDAQAQDFLRFVNAWVGLSCALNEMSHSMGQAEFYPFVLPRAAVAKLQLIHCVVRDAGA